MALQLLKWQCSCSKGTAAVRLSRSGSIPGSASSNCAEEMHFVADICYLRIYCLWIRRRRDSHSVASAWSATNRGRSEFPELIVWAVWRTVRDERICCRG